MNKPILPAILSIFCCGIAFGQTSPAPIITNTLPLEKVQKKAFNLADLVGLKGQTAPQFVLPAMDGTEYNLENLRGKVVVVNLWAHPARLALGKYRN